MRLVFQELLVMQLALAMRRRKLTTDLHSPPLAASAMIDARIVNRFPFDLTGDQKKVIGEISRDMARQFPMNRLLQGDVGSGKTIVALSSILNVIESKFQTALMAPTEILAQQHYRLTKKIFPKNIRVEILTSKTEYKIRKKIINRLENHSIDLLIGTHSLFQKNLNYKKLGLIVIDEQHKFGVKQRKKLSDKGGKDCDILVMSATPIPRTMIMTIFGDMDVSIIKKKPKNRKEIITLSKLENKIDEILLFSKKQIKNGNQIFWVCPLIEESKKIEHTSAIKKYEFLNKRFPNQVALLHGKTDNDEKEISNHSTMER